MGPPCSLHFLSNQSTNLLARLDFTIDSATLFFDNSLCSNVHSTSIESKALNIFFNDFDESFSVDSLLLLNMRSWWIRFPLKNLLEWRVDSVARLSNFASHRLAHKLFGGSFDRCFGYSSWRTVARTVPSWFEQYSLTHCGSNPLAADWHRSLIKYLSRAVFSSCFSIVTWVHFTRNGCRSSQIRLLFCNSWNRFGIIEQRASWSTLSTKFKNGIVTW